MTAINRRAMLGSLLGAAAVAALGSALTPRPAESAPLTLDKGLAASVESPVEKAAVVVVHRRRPRRRVCWWRRGRRVCGWR
ncbi:MAG: hypothetical protein ACLPSF_01465 [Methylocella sp.]